MKLKPLMLLTLTPLLLTSCGGPTSKFKATILITSSYKNKATMSFDTFEGTYVFNVKKTSDGEGAISYTASLGEGTVYVTYIALTDDENSLFTIETGETLNGSGGYVEKGYRVKIVLRSVGKVKNGNFTFDLN